MKVALYARVSSDKQDVDLSISGQLRALQEYAAKNGDEVMREFVDEAESGRTTNRPVFQEMVGLTRHKPAPFERILVWKLSRFARNREDSIIYKSLLRKRGVQVISINEPMEDSPSGRMLEGIIEVVDEFYSANLAEDVVRGMREAASRGFFVASQAPYGYRRIKVADGKKERTRLEPDPATAPVVSRIFDLALHGSGLKDIASILNEEGIAGARRKPWTKTTVHRVLTNEAYTGILVWGTTSYRGRPPQPVRLTQAWDALVPSETFRRVKASLNLRSFPQSHPRRTGSRYLLSGLLQCGSCGHGFGGQEAKSGQFSYYVCSTLLKRGRGTCDSVYVNAARLEALVVEKIRDLILTKEHLEGLSHLVNEEVDVLTREYREHIDVVDGELADLQRRLDRLYDALETGKLTLDDLHARIQYLRHRQDQLRATKADAETVLVQRDEQLLDPKMVSEFVTDMRDILAQSTLAEQRAFIKSFVREIVVRGQEAELRYNMPLPSELINRGLSSGRPSGNEGVLAIVSNGTPGETRTPAPGSGGQCSIH